MPRSRLEIALGLAILAIFAGGVARLFQLRLASGDVHPPGSSYRSDPLGARALHDALDETGRVRVARNLEDLRKLGDGAGRTLFWLGASAGGQSAFASADPLGDEGIEALAAFARSGGRLVVAFVPATVRPDALQVGRPFPNRAAVAPDQPATWYDAIEEWGAKLEFEPLKHAGVAFVPEEATLAEDRPEELFADAERDSDAETTETLLAAPPPRRLPPLATSDLPTTIGLRSGLVFSVADDSPWRAVYRREDRKGEERPVAIERAMGAGSIVALADTSLLANEAMWRERRTTLAAWLVGPAREVVFDETHLGIVSQPGMAALARRLHLEYAALALLALGGLVVWRMTSPLSPRLPDEEAGRAVSALAERDAFSGLASLMRRAIPRDRLVETCLEQWRRSHPGRVSDASAPLSLARQAAREAGGGARPTPEAVYRELGRLLDPRAGQTPRPPNGSNRRGNGP